MPSLCCLSLVPTVGHTVVAGEGVSSRKRCGRSARCLFPGTPGCYWLKWSCSHSVMRKARPRGDPRLRASVLPIPELSHAHSNGSFPSSTSHVAQCASIVKCHNVPYLWQNEQMCRVDCATVHPHPTVVCHTPRSLAVLQLKLARPHRVRGVVRARQLAAPARAARTACRGAGVRRSTFGVPNARGKNVRPDEVGKHRKRVRTKRKHPICADTRSLAKDEGSTGDSSSHALAGPQLATPEVARQNT